MPIPNGNPLEFRSTMNKVALCFGVILIIYATLSILIKLNLIPDILISIFPSIVLLIVGIFILISSFNSRKKY